MFALQAWTYAAGKGHIRVLLEVAANASHDEKKRRHVLCQFYDEAARREWGERASRGDSEFKIEEACQKLDRDLLETARMDYDNAYAPRATQDGYEVAQAPPGTGPRQGKRYGRKGTHCALSLHILVAILLF